MSPARICVYPTISTCNVWRNTAFCRGVCWVKSNLSGTVEPHVKTGGFGIRASRVNRTGDEVGDVGDVGIEDLESRLTKSENVLRLVSSASSVKLCWRRA
jgi:hypothetical protein